MKESQLVGRILKELRKRGAFAEKLHGSALQRAGMPDIICCYEGYFVGFEAKRPGEGQGDEDASNIQRQVGIEIRQAAGIWQVIDSVEDAMAVLDMVDDRIRDGTARFL